jgi:hypothetical protein
MKQVVMTTALTVVLGIAIVASTLEAQHTSGEPVATAADSAARATLLMRAVSQSLDHIPGEVLVKFRGGVGTAAQNRVFSLAPQAARSSVRWVGDVAVVAIDDRAPAAQVAERLEREPEVEEAAIKRFARDLGEPGRDADYGHGLIDARATLRGLGLVR